MLLPALYPGRRFDREKTSKPAGLLVLVKSPCVDPARPLRGTDGAHGEFPKSRLSFQFCLRYLQRARAVFAGIESGGTLNAAPVDKLGGGVSLMRDSSDAVTLVAAFAHGAHCWCVPSVRCAIRRDFSFSTP